MKFAIKVIKYILIFMGIVIIFSFFLPRGHINSGFKNSRAKTGIKHISTSLRLFKLENSFYPEKLEILAIPNTEIRKYIEKEALIDPWGNPYIYLNPGKHGEVDIYSLGADGVQSQDNIGNWQLKN